MKDSLYTTQEAANRLRVSYDHARKLLRHLTPADTQGKGNLWTLEQIKSVKTK